MQRGRFQYSLLTLLGVMFAVAFFFAWLRVNTGFKFILFGLVIMPAIAIGFAMLAGLMPQPSLSFTELKQIDVRLIAASVPPVLVRATQIRYISWCVGLCCCVVLVCGCGWMSRRDPGSASWYYAHRSALTLALFYVVAIFATRVLNEARLGNELLSLESPFHKLQNRARLGTLGVIPAGIAQLVQYLQVPNTISEIAMLFVFAIFLMSWFSNGRSGVFQKGILVRGVAIGWQKLRSHYWIPESDFVVFATAEGARAPHPLFLHASGAARDVLAKSLASRLPMADSAEHAWGDAASL